MPTSVKTDGTDVFDDTEHLDKALLHAMVENAADGIIAIDDQGIVYMINPAAQRLFGYRAEEVLGRNVTKLMPEPHRSEHHQYLRNYLDTGKRKIIGIGREVEGRRKDGSTFPMYLSVAEVRSGERRLFVGIVHDLTERKRATQELQRMHAYLENIIDSMPSILVGVDREGRVTEWNQEAEQASGVAARDAAGRRFAELLPQLSAQLDKVNEAIRRREPIHTERLVTEKDGEIRYSDVVVYPLVANDTLGAVIRVDDITARVRIEQLMVETEKMMSVGGLAAGMAHEINNPLSATLQGCQNIVRRLSPDLPANRRAAEALGVDLERMRGYLEHRGILNFLAGIDEAARRATRIVGDMLSFSRRSTSERVPARVDEMLDTVVRVAASDYDLEKKYDFRRIEILREYDPDLGEIYCDRTEIEQVFLNIIKNAAHAMAEAGTPAPQRITLRARREDRYAQVEVEDNGPGMDEETRNRVFEPFFTTKPAGVGTGLGLSVSYFIVHDQHKGTISVSSTPGSGACFLVRLPLQPEVSA